MSNQCKICGEAFSSRNKLFSHIKIVHYAEQEKNHSEDSSAEDNIQNATNSIYYTGNKLTKDNFKIIYDDKNCFVFNKPQGVATMGEKDSVYTSDMLLLNEEDKKTNKCNKARPVHRLDKPTGGLLLCSKNKEADSFFKSCFRDHLIKKKYCALIYGKLTPSMGKIEYPISNKPSVTEYEVFDSYISFTHGLVSLVYLWPISGRRHQLRKHMHMAGHFIIGDLRYSSVVTNNATTKSSNLDIKHRLYLWAIQMKFPNPKKRTLDGESQEIEVNLPIPDEMYELKAKSC